VRDPVAGPETAGLGGSPVGHPEEDQVSPMVGPATPTSPDSEAGPAGTVPSEPTIADRRVEAYIPPTTPQFATPGSSDPAIPSPLDPMGPTGAPSGTAPEHLDDAEAEPIPQAPSGEGRIQVHDKPRTVCYGDEVVELRQLTPEEKTRRRLMKNAVVIAVGILIMMTYILFHVGYWPFSR
jgi:hypothetical protein